MRRAHRSLGPESIRRSAPPHIQCRAKIQKWKIRAHSWVPDGSICSTDHGNGQLRRAAPVLGSPRPIIWHVPKYANADCAAGQALTKCCWPRAQAFPVPIRLVIGARLVHHLVPCTWQPACILLYTSAISVHTLTFCAVSQLSLCARGPLVAHARMISGKPCKPVKEGQIPFTLVPKRGHLTQALIACCPWKGLGYPPFTLLCQGADFA
jgi:hypothetical protein